MVHHGVVLQHGRVHLRHVLLHPVPKRIFVVPAEDQQLLLRAVGGLHDRDPGPAPKLEHRRVLFFQRPRPPLPFGLSLRRIPVVFAEVFGEFVVFFFVGELRVDGLDGGAVLEGERVGGSGGGGGYFLFGLFVCAAGDGVERGGARW